MPAEFTDSPLLQHQELGHDRATARCDPFVRPKRIELPAKAQTCIDRVKQFRQALEVRFLGTFPQPSSLHAPLRRLSR